VGLSPERTDKNCNFAEDFAKEILSAGLLKGLAVTLAELRFRETLQLKTFLLKYVTNAIEGMLKTQDFDDRLLMTKTSCPSTNTRGRMEVAEDEMSSWSDDPGEFLREWAHYRHVRDAKRRDCQIYRRGSEWDIAAVRLNEAFAQARPPLGLA